MLKSATLSLGVTEGMCDMENYGYNLPIVHKNFHLLYSNDVIKMLLVYGLTLLLY